MLGNGRQEQELSTAELAEAENLRFSDIQHQDHET